MARWGQGSREHLQYLALALLLVLASGCSRNPVEATDTLGVIVTTDKDVYASQERVSVTVENKLPDPILVRQCYELERRVADRWELAGHGGRCQGTFHRCQTDCRYSRGFAALGADISEGTYRFAVDVLLQEDWQQKEQVVTDAFTITH